MFEVELLKLLNKYKTAEEYEKQQIIDSLTNLIKQNPNDYDRFINSQALDDGARSVLEVCQKKIDNQVKQEQLKQEPVEDFDVVKQAFYDWVNEYKANSGQPNDNTDRIIVNLVDKYIDSNYAVLDQVIKINEGGEFELFKNSLKNYLRDYFENKIEEYKKSDEYKKLWLLKKIKKKAELHDIMNQVGEYKFDVSKMREVMS